MKTRWTPASTLPDAGITVLVYSPQSDEPVWLGYYDGQAWFDVSDKEYERPVTYWCDLPEPPKTRVTVQSNRHGKTDALPL